MTSINVSCNNLQPQHADLLGEQLCKFPALKHLDLSGNAGLRLLPVGILRVAARLETFNCNGCSLVLPPQREFLTPDQNPNRIQRMLDGHHSFKGGELKLSTLGLTKSIATNASALFQFFPSLKHLDLSCNACLGGSIGAILSSLTGVQQRACDCVNI